MAGKLDYIVLLRLVATLAVVLNHTALVANGGVIQRLLIKLSLSQLCMLFILQFQSL